MKIKHATRYPTSLMLVLGVLIAASVFTSAANAQPRFVGKFTLPYEVNWGQATLPAGEYFIRMDSMGPAKVSSANGARTVFTKPPILADNEQGSTHLTITAQGNKRIVRSLNLPELGKLVIFAPLTKSEREVVAKAGQVNTVPVVTAKK
jgi:hypothetical protein